MSERTVGLTVNGRELRAEEGTTVAASLISARHFAFRAARDGGTRGPLCGMGVCFECRVTIDGIAHQRACMTIVREGMHVATAPAEP